jgi:hypothetical protein
MPNLLILLSSSQPGTDSKLFSSIYAVCSTVFTVQVATMDGKSISWNGTPSMKLDHTPFQDVDPSQFEGLVVPEYCSK